MVPLAEKPYRVPQPLYSDHHHLALPPNIRSLVYHYASHSCAVRLLPHHCPAADGHATSITLTSIDEAALIDALQNFGAISHLPSTYTVESMVIAGGFNPKTESSDRGTATALQYAAAIGSYNLPYFKNSATLLAGSSEVPDGAVILNLQITPIPGSGTTGSATPRVTTSP